MPQHTLVLGDGTRIHYGSNDAVFRSLDGKPVIMEFHHFCGPMFTIEDDDEGGFIPDNDTPEGKHIWDQFDGWWEAKGKKKYH